jgi:putative DNA primase/helicase
MSTNNGAAPATNQDGSQNNTADATNVTNPTKEGTPIMTRPPVNKVDRSREFTPTSLAKLISSALPTNPAELERLGITAVRHRDDVPAVIARKWVKKPGMLLHDRQADGSTSYRYRPDEPVPDPDDADAKPAKSIGQPKRDGQPTPLNHMRAAAPGKPTLILEGDFQARAAARYAPADWGIVGMGGCWGWSGADLTWAEGLDIVIFHDKDLTTKRDVYDAIAGLMEHLAAEGAGAVKVAKLVGARDESDGIDDVLGYRPEHTRAAFLERLVDNATSKLPKPPVRQASRFFDASGSLKVATLAADVVKDNPAALTAEERVALYQDGVYRINGLAFTSAVAECLGEQHRSTHVTSVEQVVKSRLYLDGRVLSAHQAEPVVNVANGMLDLRTGELAEHSPDFMSTAQLPVAWVPEATCPRYEEWLKSVCPDQVDDLEEVVSTMLDPSRTPPKAVFLYGPSRSGKSTLLRIAEAVAGSENYSSVTLHQLSENRFVAANVYGKILNSAADLDSRDVEDLSLFKMLTGEDMITADRKHGALFQFTNGALFAFSANELPQVSESSRAYSERIKPFRFGNSFAGSEDPTVEDKIKEELEGILVRWVRAWQRKNTRGGYQETAAAVRREFDTRSSRVRQWLDEELEITERPGEGMTGNQLHDKFRRWAEANGGRPLGRNKLMERLRNCPGVKTTRIGTARATGLNLVDKGPFA